MEEASPSQKDELQIGLHILQIIYFPKMLIIYLLSAYSKFHDAHV